MSNNTISLLEFSADNALGAERDTARFAAAMAYCRAHEGTTLIVPPGEYTITSVLARETQAKVMAGDYGRNPQPIMFCPTFPYDRGISFAGQKGTTLVGYGVTLLVDGFMEPVSVRDCEDVTVSGITIDHKRKPYSRGVVTSVTKQEARGDYDVVVRLDEDCPVQQGTPCRLRYALYSPHTNQYFDPPMGAIEVIDSHTLRAAMGIDVVEGTGESLVGMEFYTVHTYHSRPAILIEQAKNTRLIDVTIHSQPGMGIVGNRSENILISRLSVVPSVGHHYSTNTDATHFTSIKGLLRLEYCTFDGQGDDFTNVHNYYHTITPIDEVTCILHNAARDGTHAQSLDYPDVGDKMELAHRLTMDVPCVYTVVSCELDFAAQCCRVTLDHPLPADYEAYYLADVTRLPRLEVIGCHARNHFARSILVKTRNVLIEGNTIIDPMGPAIVVAAEASWGEGVCASNVVIRRNRVVTTRNGDGAAGGIMVKADCKIPECRPIRNIVIEDNLIDCPRAPYGIYIRNADGVKLRRNRVISGGEDVFVTISSNVSVE